MTNKCYYSLLSHKAHLNYPLYTYQIHIEAHILFPLFTIPPSRWLYLLIIPDARIMHFINVLTVLLHKFLYCIFYFFISLYKKISHKFLCFIIISWSQTFFNFIEQHIYHFIIFYHLSANLLIPASLEFVKLSAKQII